MRRADNLTTFMCRLSWNLGASASWNPQGLSRPVIGLLYLYLYIGAKTGLKCIYRNYFIFNNILRTGVYVVAKVRLYFDFCLWHSEIHKIFVIHFAVLIHVTELRAVNIRRAQVKVGLINLCKGLFSLNARIYYKLNSGTWTISVQMSTFYT